MVGQGKPTISWDEVDRDNLAVIYDFRRLKSQKPLEQLSLLTFNSFLEFIKDRGIKAEKPISMIIDELPALLEYQSVEPDIRNLGARFRAYKLWPVIGHQALNQLSLALRESSRSFRNQIIGQQANIHDAEEVVRNVLGPSEQDEVMKTANAIQHFSARQFLLKRFYNEATPDLKVRWIKQTPDIPALVPGTVTEEQLAAAKLRNQRTFAPRVAEVLKKIDARLEAKQPPAQERPKV